MKYKLGDFLYFVLDNSSYYGEVDCVDTESEDKLVYRMDCYDHIQKEWFTQWIRHCDVIDIDVDELAEI